MAQALASIVKLSVVLGAPFWRSALEVARIRGWICAELVLYLATSLTPST